MKERKDTDYLRLRDAHAHLQYDESTGKLLNDYTQHCFRYQTVASPEHETWPPKLTRI